MPSLDFLIWLEQFRSGLTNAIFIAASGLGSEEAYMALLTTIYLCVGHRFGFHLFIMFLTSAYSNAQLKVVFSTPRPYALYPDQLSPLYTGSGEGWAFPSGHAQNAAVVWGIVSIRLRSRRVRAAILALVALIAFSRLYVQVHWPLDVGGGLLIGFVLVIVYLAVIGAWTASNRQVTRTQWAVLVVAVAALMHLLGYGEETCLRSAGAFLGSALGFLLLEGRDFKAAAPALTQALKVIVALAVLFGVQTGGKLLLGEAAWAISLRYVLIGFTAAYLLPVLFTQFHAWRSRIGAPRQAVSE